MIKNENILKLYPIIKIPNVTIPIKIINNFGLTAFLNKIIEGKDKAVTAIIKDKMVPTPTPLTNNASAMGIVPNISAYIGIPMDVANKTEKGFSFPNSVSIIDVGIQL